MLNLVKVLIKYTLIYFLNIFFTLKLLNQKTS